MICTVLAGIDMVRLPGFDLGSVNSSPALVFSRLRSILTVPASRSTSCQRRRISSRGSSAVRRRPTPANRRLLKNPIPMYPGP